MARKMTIAQQIERFGSTLAEVRAVRDRVRAAMSEQQVAEAQAAWTKLAAELPACVLDWKAHPEAVRFEILRALDAGKTLAEAVEQARALATEGRA